MNSRQGNRLSIREVTRENWQDALHLVVYPEQQRFIADVVPIAAIALAKAYIRPGGLLWLPYAFYAGTEIIGFTMLAYEPGSPDNYWIFHFFIDKDYQGRGYGKQALQLFIEFLTQQHTNCRSIHLTVHPENMQAQQLYIRIGFHPTGDNVEGEPLYQLRVR